MLSIQYDFSTAQVRRRFGDSQRTMSKAMEKLSSGLRINAADDGPAACVLSEQLRSQIAGVERSIRNAHDASTILSISDGGLGIAQGLLQKMRTLALNAANSGVRTRDQIAAEQAEMDSALQALERVFQTTNLAGRKILENLRLSGKIPNGASPLDDAARASPDTPAFPDKNRMAAAMPAHSPDADAEAFLADHLKTSGSVPKPSPPEVTTEKNDAKALLALAGALKNCGVDAIGGLSIPKGPIEGDGDLTLKDLYSGGRASLERDAVAALRTVDRAHDDVSLLRATIAAAQSMSGYGQENLEALARSESTVRDADIAAGATELIYSRMHAQVCIDLLSKVAQHRRETLQDLFA